MPARVSEGFCSAPDCPAARPRVLRTQGTAHKGQDEVLRKPAASMCSAASSEWRNPR